MSVTIEDVRRLMSEIVRLTRQEIPDSDSMTDDEVWQHYAKETIRRWDEKR